MMNVTGSCHCGEIAFEAKIDMEKVVICHCNDCQKLSASAYRTIAIVSADDLTFLKGTPKEYIKIAESGNRRAQGFCAECGSGIFATNADGPREIYMLRTGTLDQRRELTPKLEKFCNEALPWLSPVEGAERVD